LHAGLSKLRLQFSWPFKSYRMPLKKLLLLASLMLSLPSYSGENISALDKMLSIKHNPVAYKNAIKAGNERAVLCGYCHGRDGNSVKDTIPNLAQQNPEYLLKQFQLFANAERKNYVMEQLARILTEQERINLALYFSFQTVHENLDESLDKSLDANSAESMLEGQRRYQSFCFACHGENGKGNKDLPRLAGQKKAFLIKTLNGFKRGGGSRSNSPMVKIMNAVDNKQIEPLASYISNMR
jgi:cytochrome c553